MISVTNIGFTQEGEPYCVSYVEKDEKGHDVYIDVAPDMFELMQFTGLLDKNGKEIYEGDILKMDSWNPAIVQVAFIEGAFCLSNKDGNYIGDIHYIQHAVIPQARVIGNIYENPELIEASLK